MKNSPMRLSTADVDICICTFRRTSLAETLTSLARQEGFEGRFRVIIADNDESPSASDRVEALRYLGFEILYIHAPARNISVARNACLDASEAEFVAFIDDDEVADQYWLKEMTEALRIGQFDAVFGPVQAVYGPSAPQWMRDADLHSTHPTVTTRGIDTGYTSNALVRRQAIGIHRFDIALGRSGGEDTDLFTRLHRLGSRFGAASKALVREEVADSRMSLKWLFERAFRSGQTHARRFLSSPFVRLQAFVIAIAKAMACGLMACREVGSPAGWRREMIRMALHLGASARLLGLRDRQLYG